MSSTEARLGAVFGTALAEVARVRQARWHRQSADDGRAEFERNAQELASLVSSADTGVDIERLGSLVRAVAAWQPEQGLPLIGALGAVVRAARSTTADA